MAVYGIFTYDITDPEGYAAYSPGSLPIIAATLAKHGGESLFADSAARFEAGEKKGVVVGIKFPSDEALHAWLNDPEYASTVAIRLATTDNLTMFIADALEPGD
jgi:uncharacterized protein (DUF1330 family)